MKTFSVQAFYPQLVAHRAYHSATATGIDFATAAFRALRELRKRDGIRGHHLNEVQLKIKVIENGAVSSPKDVD